MATDACSTYTSLTSSNPRACLCPNAKEFRSSCRPPSCFEFSFPLGDNTASWLAGKPYFQVLWAIANEGANLVESRSTMEQVPPP